MDGKNAELETETFVLYLEKHKDKIKCKIRNANQKQLAHVLTNNYKLNLPVSGDENRRLTGLLNCEHGKCSF